LDDNNEQINNNNLIQNNTKNELHQYAYEINNYKFHVETIRFVQKIFFNRISKKDTKYIIEKIFNYEVKNIKLDWSNMFISFNKLKLNENNCLKDDFILKLKEKIEEFIIQMSKGISEKKYINIEIEDNINEIMNDKKINFNQEKYEKNKKVEFELNKNTLYEFVRNAVCHELGDINFIYDFDKTDLIKTYPQNINTLQRTQLHIVNSGIPFGLFVEYFFECTECGQTYNKKHNEIICSNFKVKCDNTIPKADGEGVKRCNKELFYDPDKSYKVDCYFYEALYTDEYGEKRNVYAYSFKKINPGSYDSVFFKINTDKFLNTFLIMDVKKLEKKSIILPEKNKNEHYCLTLIKSFDNFIKNQTGEYIYGLLPIKIALIIQKLAHCLEFDKIFNVQIVGDPSTGKSLILKKYGYFLYNYMHCETNGASISVPALRGTRKSVSFFGKEYRIISAGYLGKYHSIHIDEVGNKQDLIDDLKAFLYEENYSYDKADSTGIFYKRTAHVNISQNVNYLYTEKYRSKIRKEYLSNDFVVNTPGSNENKEENKKLPWNEGWDLFMPLYKYDNIYLRNAIRKIRMEFANNNIFWMDGFENALHQRFPFYFYLKNDNKNPELKNKVIENLTNKIISEGYDLITLLYNDELDKLFIDMKQYISIDKKYEVSELKKVDEFLDKYHIERNSRIDKFYYLLLTLSRIINQRTVYEQEDFYFVEYMIQNTQCIKYLNELNEYKLTDIPDYEKEYKKDIDIENAITILNKDNNTQFGLQGDDFD
jgi:hypothetical protein